MTYVNWVEPFAGVGETHSELAQVLRIVSGQAADGPFHTVEQLAARYSFQLHGADGSSEVGETLQEMRALEDDWDGYGALAPISPALERAWHLASMLVEECLPLPP